MAMTRKDFQLIADVIRNLDEVIEPEGMRILAEEMADALATTNANFDRARFVKACGVN